MMELLQWTGFILIVGGYWRFRTSQIEGATISLIGCVPLLVWAFLMGAWGVFALQAACIVINGQTIRENRT